MMHMFRLITGKIEKATRHSAAFDLFYSGDQPLILTDTPVAIPTNVRTIFSPGLVAIIKEKSGLALKGIELKGGVIDADYRDEWKVIARCPPHLEFDPRNREAFESGEEAADLYELWSYNMAFGDMPFTHYLVQPGQKIAQFVLIELPDVAFENEIGAEVIVKSEQRTGGLGSTGLGIESKAS